MSRERWRVLRWKVGGAVVAGVITRRRHLPAGRRGTKTAGRTGPPLGGVMTDYIVVFYTHGSFQDFAAGPFSLEEAREFVRNPPNIWMPRPQDSLEVFRLEPVEEDEFGEATP